MIKFTVSTMNYTELKTLLSVNIDDYVTVFLTKTSCYFILNSMEIYLHKGLPIIVSDNLEESMAFRVDRKKLLNLLIEGSITFLVGDDIISITFKDTESKTRYTMDVVHQTGFNETILNKMRLITQSYQYESVSIERLKSLARVSSNLNLPITVSGGYAHAGNREFSCFSKVDLPDFAVNSRLLTLMLKFTKKAYNVQNYLIHDEDGMAIVLAKYRQFTQFDINFITRQKSSHKVVLHIDNLIELCNKVDKTDGRFLLDVENSVARFEKDKVIYSTPLKVINVKSAKKVKQDREVSNESVEDLLKNIDLSGNSVMSMSEHNVPPVEIPIIVLTKLLPALGLKKMASISYKKTFMELNGGSTYITFARREV